MLIETTITFHTTENNAAGTPHLLRYRRYLSDPESNALLKRIITHLKRPASNCPNLGPINPETQRPFNSCGADVMLLVIRPRFIY